MSTVLNININSHLGCVILWSKKQVYHHFRRTSCLHLKAYSAVKMVQLIPTKFGTYLPKYSHNPEECNQIFPSLTLKHIIRISGKESKEGIKVKKAIRNRMSHYWVKFTEYSEHKMEFC